MPRGKPFEKGNAGRPKGAKGKTLSRERLDEILEDEGLWKKFDNSLRSLSDKAFVDAWVAILPYKRAKLASINLSLASMPEEDLELVVHRLRDMYGKSDDL